MAGGEPFAARYASIAISSSVRCCVALAVSSRSGWLVVVGLGRHFDTVADPSRHSHDLARGVDVVGVVVPAQKPCVDQRLFGGHRAHAVHRVVRLDRHLERLEVAPCTRALAGWFAVVSGRAPAASAAAAGQSGAWGGDTWPSTRS